MRLFIIPISTRRSFIYAHRLVPSSASSSGGMATVDKAVDWVAAKWAQWEKQDSGWQKRVVDYGNQALRRIPYQEWGLKSVPPYSSRRRHQAVDDSKQQPLVELLFPSNRLAANEALSVAHTLATERQRLHRQKLWHCFAGMPLTLPFALVPVIPNLPFFYLVYRAWSHWRALSGGRHVQWLVDNRLLQPSPSAHLNRLYTSQQRPPATPHHKTSEEEKMLLGRDQVQILCETLSLPALEVDLERAIWQVESSLKENSSSS